MFSALMFILNFLTLTFINITIGVKNDDNAIVLMIIIITVQTVALFMDMYITDGVLKKFRLQIFSGYILRIVLLVLDIYGRNIIKLPNSGADSVAYYNRAVKLSQNIDVGNTNTFTDFFGLVFRCVGTNKIFAQFCIVMCSIVILWLFAKSIQLLKVPNDKATILMFVFCLLPNFAIMSSIFLREIPIAMLTAISIYTFIYCLVKNKYYILIISFASLMLASSLHAGVSIICIGYILVLFLYSPKFKKYIFSPGGLTFAIIFTVAFLYLYINYSDTFFTKFMKVDTIDDLANDRAEGGSTYAQFVGNSSSPLNMLIYTIPRILYFLFSPFPWQWRNLIDVFSFIFSSMFYATSMFLTIRAIVVYHGEKRNIAIALLIIALIVSFVFGWGVSNTGTAIRHRDKLVYLFGIMIVNYFSKIKQRRVKVC